MRDKVEIEKKLTEIYDKRLKIRIRKYLKKGFMNCRYNERLIIDDNSVIKVGCCTNAKKKKAGNQLVVCNNDATACACELYTNANARQDIEEEFANDISDPKTCGQTEPKIAVLLWVLHSTNAFPEEEQIGVLKRRNKLNHKIHP